MGEFRTRTAPPPPPWRPRLREGLKRRKKKTTAALAQLGRKKRRPRSPPLREATSAVRGDTPLVCSRSGAGRPLPRCDQSVPWCAGPGRGPDRSGRRRGCPPRGRKEKRPQLGRGPAEENERTAGLPEQGARRGDAAQPSGGGDRAGCHLTCDCAPGNGAAGARERRAAVRG